MPSERAAQMSALFDIDLDTSFDESSDYDAKAKDSNRAESFEDKVVTMQSIMEPEPEPENVEDIEEEIPPKASSKEKETDQLLKEALEDIQEKPKETQPSVEAETVPPVINAETKEDNPLGLIGDDYRFFKQLETKYPQFTTYNGNPAYKEFYRYKVQALKAILTKFPVLDFDKMRQEARHTNIDHTIGDVPTAEAIRAKLDESYRSRIRVVQLLTEATEQFPIWEKSIELLEAKLWFDHESRGAHKRAALALLHMHGEQVYVQEMHGFIQSIKIIDSFLKDGSESLSRQLTCVSLKEPSSADHTYRYEQELKRRGQTIVDKKMDELDSISEGSVISAPPRSSAPRIAEGLGKFDPHDRLMDIS